MRAYIAEFIGTCALILFGAGSIIVTHTMVGSSAALLVVALAHGFIIACMVSTLGAISGGHFNPAVTFGFIVGNKMSK
ncbi:MAG: aquaporin, partial [Patescibacteria group bacterium]